MLGSDLWVRMLAIDSVSRLLSSVEMKTSCRYKLRYEVITLGPLGSLVSLHSLHSFTMFTSCDRLINFISWNKVHWKSDCPPALMRTNKKYWLGISTLCQTWSLRAPHLLNHFLQSINSLSLWTVCTEKPPSLFATLHESVDFKRYEAQLSSLL